MVDLKTIVRLRFDFVDARNFLRKIRPTSKMKDILFIKDALLKMVFITKLFKIAISHFSSAHPFSSPMIPFF